MGTDEGDVSNYLVVNIKKNSYGTFKLSQSHLAEKIIIHVVLTLSASIKPRDIPSGKPLMNKEESSLLRKCVWNYSAAFSMFSYLKISICPEISNAIHQCARLSNNPRPVHECAVISIAKYLGIMSKYVDLLDTNQLLTTRGVVYSPNT